MIGHTNKQIEITTFYIGGVQFVCVFVCMSDHDRFASNFDW